MILRDDQDGGMPRTAGEAEFHLMTDLFPASRVKIMQGEEKFLLPPIMSPSPDPLQVPAVQKGGFGQILDHGAEKNFLGSSPSKFGDFLSIGHPESITGKHSLPAAIAPGDNLTVDTTYPVLPHRLEEVVNQGPYGFHTPNTG